LQTKREQFETLSRELLGKLTDVTVNSELFFPFGYVLPAEIEEKYFYKGLILRALTIRNMIVIDNSFKKFQIFPSHDIMVTYVETQKDLLSVWVTEAIEEYQKMTEHIEEGKAKELEFEDFKGVVNTIQADINKASMVAIKEVASSDEAKALNNEYSGSSGGFIDFIHNKITSLFK